MDVVVCVLDPDDTIVRLEAEKRLADHNIGDTQSHTLSPTDTPTGDSSNTKGPRVQDK